jgi:hypothetical protein
MNISSLTLPVIFAILGGLLLLSSLAQLPTPWGQFGITSGRLRAVAAVAGIALAIGAVYVYLHQPGSASTAAVPSPPTALPDKEPTLPKSSSVDTEALISVIKDKQHQTVGDSTGTLDYQCFTHAKLAAFDKQGVPNQIASELKKDAGFVQLTLAIRAMEPAARQQLLRRAASTYRPSWAQLGLEPATSNSTKLLTGQTTAGSTAEREIAEAITNLVKDLCNRPEGEIKQLLNQS